MTSRRARRIWRKSATRCAAVKRTSALSSASASLTSMDIHLRPVTVDDAEALAHVLVSAQESAFRGIVPDQCLDFTEAQSAANWRRFFSEEGVPSGSDFMVIAETDDGDAIGYTWGRVKAESSGEVYQLSVLPAYQKRGIGRQ